MFNETELEIKNLFGEHVTDIKSIIRNVFKATYDGRSVKIKKTENEYRATTEFNNQQEAYRLLKQKGLKVPGPIDIKHSWIVSEFIEGNGQLSLKKALGYLHGLHSLDVDFAKKDYYNHFHRNLNDHYGKNLIERLRQENEFLSKAIQRYPEFSNLEKDFNSILKNAISYISSDSDPLVIGHGDFKPDNIIMRGSEIVLIDWIDFGISSRWYDLGNLLFGQEKDELLALVKYYLELCFGCISSKKIKDVTKMSLSIAFVIQTGSHFRHVIEPATIDPSEDFSKAKENIKYINEILTILDGK